MKKYYLIATAVALGWFLLFILIGSNRHYFYVATSNMTATMSERSRNAIEAEFKANGVRYTEETFTIDIERGRFWELKEKAGRWISFYDAGDEYIIESSKLYLVTPGYIEQLEKIPSSKRSNNQAALIYKWRDSSKDNRIMWFMLLPMFVVGILAFMLWGFDKEELSEEDLKDILSAAHFSTFIMLLEIALLVAGVYCFGSGSASPLDILMFNKFSELGLGILFAIIFIALAVANIALCLVTNKALLKCSHLKFSWRSVLIAVGIMMAAAFVCGIVTAQLNIETGENWTISIICFAIGLAYWLYDTAKNSPQIFKILPLLILSTAIMVVFAYVVSFVLLIIAILVGAIFLGPTLHKAAQNPSIFTGRERGACCTSCQYWDGSHCSIKSNTLDIDPSQGCGDFVYRTE